MHGFSLRRSTEGDIAHAITLGWRIAELYCLRADDLSSAPPDNLLPTRRSLPAAERLVLELRAAAGDAVRLGVALPDSELERLLALAGGAPDDPAQEGEFRDRIRAWHVDLETALWASKEADGKAYELGNFLSDTCNRVALALRDGGRDAHAQVTHELRRVFDAERVERIMRLLDDLQARIDPAAARIVRQHLAAWREAARDRAPREATPAGLEPLRRQVATWVQLVTGDKEPEAFIGHDERARLRGTMIGRMLRSYRGSWRCIVASAAVMAGLAAGAYTVLSADGLESVRGPIFASLGPLAGALGLSFTSIGLTVRKSLDARAELLWNTALVEVISARTLLVDDLLRQRKPRRMRLSLPAWPPRAAARRRPGAGSRRLRALG